MKNFLSLALVAASALIISCGQKSEGDGRIDEVGNDVVDSQGMVRTPSRKAEKGYKWEEVRGAGLRFFAQCSPSVRAVTDASVPGIRIERIVGGRKEYSEPVIRVFTIDANFIQSLLPQLRNSPRLPDASWLDSEDCEFKEVESGRLGVTRYVLQLTGRSAELLAEKGKHESIPYTCGGWGLGNKGMRYFEVFASHPDKAIFVEENDDAKFIDEKSVEPYDIIRNVKGTMVIGHEVRSFKSDGDSATYWLVDKSGESRILYREVLGASVASYAPVHVTMEVSDLGKSIDGFAEDYDGVYEIRKIIDMKQSGNGY